MEVLPETAIVTEARPHVEQPELFYILLTYFPFQCPYFSASSTFSHYHPLKQTVVR